MSKEFSHKVTFFNFFYSILVLCYHANANVMFKDILPVDTSAGKIIGWMNHALTESSGTYFFMLLSAFLLYRDITKENAWRKVKHRIKSLLIPWIVWNAIGVLSYHPFDKGIKYIISYFLTSRFCEQLWFVQMLLIMLLFIPLLQRALKRKGIREIILISLFVMGYYHFPFMAKLSIYPSVKFQAEVLRFLNHVPIYCLGAYLGLNYSESILQEQYNQKNRVLALVFAIGVIICSYLPLNNFLYYIGFTMRPIGIWIICRKEFFKFEPLWWMQVPFYTYAIHNFILHWEEKIIRLSGLFAEEFKTSTITVEFAFAWRIVLTVTTFIAVLVSALILMKVTPKFYECLSGGRIPDRMRDKKMESV